MSIQPSLFAPDPDAVPAKPSGDDVERMTLLIVVKAAPNPSQTYGETVCVAALRIDPHKPGWIRLYPINFRALEDPKAFRKYFGPFTSSSATDLIGDRSAHRWGCYLCAALHPQVPDA